MNYQKLSKVSITDFCLTYLGMPGVELRIFCIQGMGPSTELQHLQILATWANNISPHYMGGGTEAEKKQISPGNPPGEFITDVKYDSIHNQVCNLALCEWANPTLT